MALTSKYIPKKMGNVFVPAFPGVTAIFSDKVGSGDPIVVDVIMWVLLSDERVVSSLVIYPKLTWLVDVSEVPVPNGYTFDGYEYCR